MNNTIVVGIDTASGQQNRLDFISGNNTSATSDLTVGNADIIFSADFYHGINTQQFASTTQASGTIDSFNGRARLQTGINSTGGAILRSIFPFPTQYSMGCTVQFDYAFDAGASSNTQVVGLSASDYSDAFLLYKTNTTFGIIHRRGGSDIATITQSSFNGNTVNDAIFTLDPTKGNKYKISYLPGYNAVKFYVQNAVTGSWILMHTLQFGNISTTPSILKPNLYFMARNINSGNTTNITNFLGAVVARCDSTFIPLGPQWGATSFRGSVSTVNTTHVITIKNATTYNGVVNHNNVFLSMYNATWDGANLIGLFDIRRNATLTDTFQPVQGTTGDNGVTITNGQSSASVGLLTTTPISGGTIIQTFSLSRNSTLQPVFPKNLIIPPGNTLSFTCIGVGTGSGNAQVNITIQG